MQACSQGRSSRATVHKSTVPPGFRNTPNPDSPSVTTFRRVTAISQAHGMDDAPPPGAAASSTPSRPGIWGFLRKPGSSAKPEQLPAEFASLKGELKLQKAAVSELEKECDLYKKSATEHAAATRRFHAFFRRFGTGRGLGAAGPPAFLTQAAAAQAELAQLAENGIALAADALAASATSSMSPEIERVRALKNAVYLVLSQQQASRGAEAEAAAQRLATVQDECMSAMRGLDASLRDAVVRAVASAAATQATALRAAAARLDALAGAPLPSLAPASGGSADAPPSAASAGLPASPAALAPVAGGVRSPFRSEAGPSAQSGEVEGSIESPLRAGHPRGAPQPRKAAAPSVPAAPAVADPVAGPASVTLTVDATTADVPSQLPPAPSPTPPPSSFSLLVGEVIVECCEGVSVEVGPTAGVAVRSNAAAAAVTAATPAAAAAPAPLAPGVLLATNYRLRWFPTTALPLPSQARDRRSVESDATAAVDGPRATDRLSFSEWGVGRTSSATSEIDGVAAARVHPPLSRSLSQIVLRRRFESTFDLAEAPLLEPGAARRGSRSVSISEASSPAARALQCRITRIAAMTASRLAATPEQDLSSSTANSPPGRPRGLSDASGTMAHAHRVPVTAFAAPSPETAATAVAPTAEPAEYLSVPLLSIARVQSLSGPNGSRILVVQCSDARRVAFRFPAADTSGGEVAQTRVSRLVSALGDYTWVSAPTFPLAHKLSASPSVDGWRIFSFESELARLSAQGPAALARRFRLSTLNDRFRLSPTYPEQIIIPHDVSDVVAAASARFRSKRLVESEGSEESLRLPNCSTHLAGGSAPSHGSTARSPCRARASPSLASSTRGPLRTSTSSLPVALRSAQTTLLRRLARAMPARGTTLRGPCVPARERCLHSGRLMRRPPRPAPSLRSLIGTSPLRSHLPRQQRTLRSSLFSVQRSPILRSSGALTAAPLL